MINKTKEQYYIKKENDRGESFRISDDFETREEAQDIIDYYTNENPNVMRLRIEKRRVRIK